MTSLILILFAAGVITILLPCILPLIPIVLGTSIAGRSRLRPLLVILGMLLSFVLFTFLFNVLLAQFVYAANYARIATYEILFLFGMGFLVHRRMLLLASAVIGAFFFSPEPLAMLIAAVVGCIAVLLASPVVSWLQNLGAGVQQSARENFGTESPLAAFLIGLTLGLVWVPCAGPALAFVLTLLRERPGVEAVLLLTAYGAGTALPLLLVGYGGQYAAHSVHAISRFSGRIKQVSGVLLVLSALALQYNVFVGLQTWLVTHTEFGTLGTALEERFFGERLEEERREVRGGGQ